MKISMIACVTSDMCIGVDNRLLISLQPDMNYFKQVTSGHTVVMGKNTYLSLPGKRPLSGRNNVIISSTLKDIQGFTVFKSVQEFIDAYKEKDDEVFIIGGASIYDAFMPYAEKIILTHVHRDGITLLNNKDIDYEKVVRFPRSVYDYKWDIYKSDDEVCLDERYGIVHYNFLTLCKLYALR